MLQQVTPEWLQSIEVLKEVPLTQLNWLIQHSQQMLLKEGEFLAQPGTVLNAMHVVINGKMRLYIPQQQGVREIGVFEPGDITGYLPFSRAKSTPGFVEALEETQLMRLESTEMPEMIREYFELTQALVHVMATRIRNFTALQQQNEKMMALGKLSAGLAHELNNPAAAIARDATALNNLLQLSPEHLQGMLASQIGAEQAEVVTRCLFDALNKENKPAMSLMQRSEAEDDVNDWLEDHHVPNVCDISEPFVASGLTVKELELFKPHIPEPQLPMVMKWIGKSLSAGRLVSDIQESSRRISELVGAVKNFTHMDRGQDKQYADIHLGIRNTLTILNHRIKKAKVKLIENFDTSLPPVSALIGELNQVWTNLIDNAVDALESVPDATLEIRTRRDGIFVQVCIIDNGPGIPEDICSRIFEPFFTTKEMGKGTGLGLDVVHQIVQQHHGTVKVNSRPGRTAFEVCFPING
ncbi:ATP-binding protein [Mucilaginibacter koreensis]